MKHIKKIISIITVVAFGLVSSITQNIPVQATLEFPIEIPGLGVRPPELEDQLAKFALIHETNIINAKYGTNIPAIEETRYAQLKNGSYIFLGIGEAYYRERLKDIKVNSGTVDTISMSEIKGTPLFAGDYVLNNINSGTNQTLSTPEFTYSYATTSTTSTTQGVKVGSKISATKKFIVAEGSIELSAEYNFNKTDTKTDTKTVTYRIPPQNILVPSGKKYQVRAFLDTGKLSVDVNLNADVSGSLFAAKTDSYEIDPGLFIFPGKFTPVGTMLKETTQNTRDKFPQFKENGNNISTTIAKGKFTAEYGTKFTLIIEDITNPNASPKVVKRTLVPMS